MVHIKKNQLAKKIQLIGQIFKFIKQAILISFSSTLCFTLQVQQHLHLTQHPWSSNKPGRKGHPGSMLRLQSQVACYSLLTQILQSDPSQNRCELPAAWRCWCWVLFLASLWDGRQVAFAPLRLAGLGCLRAASSPSSADSTSPPAV